MSENDIGIEGVKYLADALKVNQVRAQTVLSLATTFPHRR